MEKYIFWDQLKSEFEGQEGRYATAEQKISALKGARLIRAKTRKLLEKAKRIRNVLAHRYMPQAGIGLSATGIARYSSIAEEYSALYG